MSTDWGREIREDYEARKRARLAREAAAHAREKLLIEQEAEILQKLWATLFKEFGTPTPSQTQMFVWLGMYSRVAIEAAIHATLKKAFQMSQRGDRMTPAYQVNYCGKVLKSRTEDEVKAELDAFRKAGKA